MRSSPIVERQIPFQPLLSRADGFKRMKIDLFRLETPPEPVDKDVGAPASSPIHTDLNPVVVQQSREFLARELAPLIGVEDLRAAILRNGLSHGAEAEVCRQRIGEPPGQDLATGPVHDGEEILKASPHGNISDIGRPDVIGATDRAIAEEIGIDRVGQIPPTQLRFPIERLRAHPAHQGGDLAPTNDAALLPQEIAEHAHPRKGILRDSSSIRRINASVVSETSVGW